MKVFLLHRDQDFAVKPELHDEIYDAMMSGDPFAVTRVRQNRNRRKDPGPPLAPTGNDAVLTQDLELQTLWDAMAGGDEFLFEMAKRTLLSSLTDLDAITYRQRVLADCLEHPEVIRQLYRLAVEALDNERTVGGLWSFAGPSGILSRSVRALELQADVLRRLRQIADQEEANGFRSEGFTRFFAMLREELADDYLKTVEQHLRELEFRRGVFESAELGKGFRGRRYVVRTPREQRWTERLPFGNRSDSYGFTIPPRDENGSKALEEIRGRGLNLVANSVAQSADHVKSFFTMLRLELAFYLGCLNLHESLTRKGEPVCFPEPVPVGGAALSGQGIYDVCLTLHLDGRRAVGNEVNADGKSLVMITGANQGGKSTLLRSLALAHLMMQAGLFTGARSLRASVCAGVFTHYKREEDATMESGKLDEELKRMSAIADQITRHSILLCNESFASTNEREGSEIARQVVQAMLRKQIKVFFVTHMYDLAHGLHAKQLDDALFLRAERQPDGRRTFRLTEGEPLPTSYGEDSYRRVFDATDHSPATRSALPSRGRSVQILVPSHARKSYDGRVVLDDVTLGFLPGAKIGVGPNGTGKSTLLRLMAGLEQPSNGYEQMIAEAASLAKTDFEEIRIPPGPRLGSLVVEAEHLVKGFGDRLLIDDLSFSLPPNGIIGVIGPNGVGKTTLLKMITGARARGPPAPGHLPQAHPLTRSRDRAHGRRGTGRDTSVRHYRAC